MRSINNIIGRTSCALAIGFLALASNSYADPGPQSLRHINTENQVSALKSGGKVAMVCTKCKTVQIAEADRKKGILGWFQPKTKHLCPGCGGYIVPTMHSVKGIEPPQFVHTCSKCGSSSTYCCGSETKGM